MKFGVEIECCVPDGYANSGTFSGFIKENGFDFNYDYSIQPGRNFVGLEYTSKPMAFSTSNIKKIKNVVNKIKDVGGEVNSSCGLHVHINARYLSRKDIFNIFHRYTVNEDRIDTLVTKDRRKSNNPYCISNTFTNWKNVSKPAQFDRFNCYDITNDSRYFKVNLEALDKHGTIEFRQHHATLNADEMIGWVEFLQKFVTKSTKIDPFEFDMKINPELLPIKDKYGSIKSGIDTLYNNLHKLSETEKLLVSSFLKDVDFDNLKGCDYDNLYSYTDRIYLLEYNGVDESSLCDDDSLVEFLKDKSDV